MARRGDHQGPRHGTASSRIKSAGCAPDFGKDFLGNFLGLGRVADHGQGQGQAVDRIGQLREDPLEGAVLPAGNGCDELIQIFGVTGPLSRPPCRHLRPRMNIRSRLPSGLVKDQGQESAGHAGRPRFASTAECLACLRKILLSPIRQPSGSELHGNYH